nr:hypothetical protein [Tanacetum cinerariifolium]
MVCVIKHIPNNLRNSSNTSRANQDNTLRINKGTGYDNQRAVNVAGARENVGTQVVQQFRIPCYNCKEYRHVAWECQKPKRAKDATYYKEKMLLRKVTPDDADNSRPIFDTEPLQKKTQFSNEIERLSREYYYADYINAILGVYTKFDEVTNLQCDYLELLQKCECLETELSKSKKMSKSFESVQKHAINLELELQQCKEKDLKAQFQVKGIVISELKKLIEKLKGKSVDTNKVRNRFKMTKLGNNKNQIHFEN